MVVLQRAPRRPVSREDASKEDATDWSAAGLQLGGGLDPQGNFVEAAVEDLVVDLVAAETEVTNAVVERQTQMEGGNLHVGLGHPVEPQGNFVEAAVEDLVAAETEVINAVAARQIQMEGGNLHVGLGHPVDPQGNFV